MMTFNELVSILNVLDSSNYNNLSVDQRLAFMEQLLGVITIHLAANLKPIDYDYKSFDSILKTVKQLSRTELSMAITEDILNLIETEVLHGQTASRLSIKN